MEETQNDYGTISFTIDTARNVFTLAARLATSPVTGMNNGMDMVTPKPLSRGGELGFLVLLPIIAPIAIAGGFVGAAVKPFWVAGDALVRCFDTVAKAAVGDDVPWLSNKLRDLNHGRSFQYVGPEYHKAESYDFD